MGDAMDISKDPTAASDAPETAVPEAASTDPTNDSTDAADGGAAVGDVATPSADGTAGAAGNGGAGTDPTSSSGDAPPPEASAATGAENPTAPSPKEGAASTAAPAAAATKAADEAESAEDVEAMAAAAIKAALAAAAGSGAGAKEGNGTAASTGDAAEQPKKKRTRRGGWDTPAAPAAVVKKGWGDAPKPVAPAVPMNPLQVRVMLYYTQWRCFSLSLPLLQKKKKKKKCGTRSSLGCSPTAASQCLQRHQRHHYSGHWYTVVPPLSDGVLVRAGIPPLECHATHYRHCSALPDP